MYDIEKLHFIKLNTFGFPYRIFINGCPIFNSEIDSICTAHFTIEQWLKPGINNVTFTPTSPIGTELPNESRIDCSIFIGNSLDQTPIANFSEKLNSYKVGTSLEIFTFNFTGKSSISHLPWENGIALQDMDDMFSKTWDLYQLFHKALVEKNVSKLLELYKSKSKDMATRHDEDINVYEKMLFEKLESMLYAPGYNAWPMKKERLALKLYGQGKLACLETPDGNSPLLLFNEEEEYCSYFDAFAYAPSGENKLVLIR